MKVPFVLFIVLALARTMRCDLNLQVEYNAVKNLGDDFKDIQALIPFDKMKTIVINYFNNDEEFQELVEYVLSDENKDTIRQVESIDELRQVFAYLHEHHVGIYERLNQLHALLELEPFKPFKTLKATGGLKGFVKEIKKLIPVDDLKALYDQKLETSEDFRNAIQFFKSDVVVSAIKQVKANSGIQAFVKYLEERGVQVHDIANFLYQFIGIPIDSVNLRVQNFVKYLTDRNVNVQEVLDVIQHVTGIPTKFTLVSRTLGDDLIDFSNLLPHKEIDNLLWQYDQDLEFKEFVTFLLSDNSRLLVQEVEVIPEIRDVIAYLHNGGVEVHEVLNVVHDLLNLEAYKPFARNEITGGLSGFYKDFKALIPFGEIRKLFHEKLQNSVPFKEAFEYFQSEAVKRGFVKVKQNEHVQAVVQYVREHVHDVDQLLRQAPSRSLGDDLRDLRALIPEAAVKEIVQAYFNQDSEFQDFLEYFLSDDTREMVRQIESIAEVRNVIAYLHNGGADVHEVLQQVHTLLEMEAYKPFSRVQITGGLAGLVKDIKAHIPFDKIKELYEHKLQTSQAFRDAVQYFKSEPVQAGFKKVRENQHVKDVVKYLQDHHVDIHAVGAFIQQITGIPVYFRAMSKGLSNDFNDFQTLWPSEKISSIISTYSMVDKEFEAFEEFLLCEEFKVAIQEIESMQGVRELIALLHNNGASVREIINRIHNMYGLEPYVSFVPSRKGGFEMKGVAGFFKDVENVIPFDQLEALYESKIASSVEFQNFVKHLRSPEVHSTIESIKSHPAVVKFAGYLKDKRVDYQKFVDFYDNIFGDL